MGGAELVLRGPTRSGLKSARSQWSRSDRLCGACRVTHGEGSYGFPATTGRRWALNGGFTAPIVMALGGWKTERMMRRYAAVTDQTLRAAAEAVSGNEAPHLAKQAARGL